MCSRWGCKPQVVVYYAVPKDCPRPLTSAGDRLIPSGQRPSLAERDPRPDWLRQVRFLATYPPGTSEPLPTAADCRGHYKVTDRLSTVK